jgi:hypothetical protein
MKLHSLIMVGNMVHTDIDEKLAVYLQLILKMWNQGERDRHWVMKQLEKAFEDAGAKLRAEKGIMSWHD